MNQTQFEATAAGRSQADLILDALRRHPGAWLPMPTLAHLSGAFAVHSRVSDLRRRGFVIDQESRRVGRAVHSFYRLASEPVSQCASAQ